MESKPLNCTPGLPLSLKTTFTLYCSAACQDLADELNMEPLQLPRVRKPPARYTGPAEAHAADNIGEFYRPHFLAFIDNRPITTELLPFLLGYFSAEGLKTYSKLENILFRVLAYSAQA